MRSYYQQQSLETIKEADLEIFITGEKSAIAFQGNSQKRPYFHYRFSSSERMRHYIENAIEERAGIIIQNEKWKKELQERKEEMIKKIKVGDIFYDSWGYEQTNVNFYQVIKRNPRSVVIRELCQDRIETHWLSGTTRPIKDAFLADSKPTTKMINAHGVTGLFEWKGNDILWSSYH